LKKSKKLLQLFWFLFITSLYIPQSNATDYGTTGLIETPTARMQKDAVLTTTIMTDEYISSYMVTYQAFEWLEATYRYTGFKALPNQNWDRNFEIKANLLNESHYLPAISVGIRDALGTGVFSSEYVVASKQWDNFDFTTGFGWGLLADKSIIDNPLSLVSERFDSRQASFGNGGTFSLDSFFSGKKIGLFGGIKYTFDNIPLALSVEYDPNTRLSGSKGYDDRPTNNQINVGMTYEFAKDAFLSLNYKHNDSFGLAITGRIDTNAKPTKYNTPQFISSLDMADSDLPPEINPSSWYDLLLFDIERADVFLLGAKLYLTEQRAELEITNFYYPYWPQAVDKIHQLASLHLPANIKRVDYVLNLDGHKIQTVRLPRNKGLNTESFTVANDAIILPSRVIINPQHKTSFVKDEVVFAATLDNRLMLFDPDQPLSYQIYVNLGTKVPLPQEWNLFGSYRFDLYNNFGLLRRYSNSALPPVRTNTLRYLQEGLNGLEDLYLDKRGTFAAEPRLHYRLYGGVLETMYSGVGGELLFQPNRSRIAVGLSANIVKQRAFDGSLRHLDYETYTAFASLYWSSPYDNYDFAIHAGRYLAKDIGATFEFRRTFDNGWQIGAWATLTDVPFEQFGEGSFDKGFFLRVPLGNLFGNKTKSTYQTRIRPIQRDGGARLSDHSGNLWFDMRDARYDVFSKAERW